MCANAALLKTKILMLNFFLISLNDLDLKTVAIHTN
jgi:hypothetical protein